MKRYEFKLIITEGNDEFWESLNDKPGCDEVIEAIKVCLEGEGWFVNEDDTNGNQLWLEKYTNFDQGKG